MILVTGATGFLGSELALQLLDRGDEVRCTKRAGSIVPLLLRPYQHRIQWVNADMLDIFALEKALEGVTQVYHCAAWVSLKRADKKKMIHTNVTGTANLVNLCVKLNIRLLHVSSIAAIGTALPGELINENNHLEGATEDDGYAISKLESEMEVWRGIAEGLNAVIVNPSLIIGANAGTEGSGLLFEAVYKWGVKFYTLGTVGFVDVVDVARCMIMLMNSEIHSERFIVSSENLTYQQVTVEIAKHLNMPAPTLLARPWMMELAWRSAALLSRITRKAPLIDKVSAQIASETRNYDNFKIRHAIGVEFKPINESIKDICEDWHLSLQVV